MENKKQSSVEWLEQQFQIIIEKNNIELEKIWQQLKAMHKEEVIDTFFEGAYGGDNISGEQYYNETFGGQNEN